MIALNLHALLLLESGLPVDDVFRIIDTAPLRYRSYPIPKRTGGFRQIAQPARELKVLQHVVLDHILSTFPVHPSASAYEAGRSIYHNAKTHAGAGIILKLDFQSFFPSIVPRDWAILAKSSKKYEISDLEIRVISRLLFWGDGKNSPKKLSIGAPTSPKMSNIILFDFDSKLSKFANDLGVNYTRYADDITVSGDDIVKLRDFENFARLALSEMKSPKLKINESKRGIYRKGERQMVTGLILTPEGKVSIGRDRKRLINSLLDRVRKSTASVEQIAQAKGYLAFAFSVEPDFVDRMKAKYGTSTIQFVLSFEIPSRADRAAS